MLPRRTPKRHHPRPSDRWSGTRRGGAGVPRTKVLGLDWLMPLRSFWVRLGLLEPEPELLHLAQTEISARRRVAGCVRPHIDQEKRLCLHVLASG